MCMHIAADDPVGPIVLRRTRNVYKVLYRGAYELRYVKYMSTVRIHRINLITEKIDKLAWRAVGSTVSTIYPKKRKILSASSYQVPRGQMFGESGKVGAIDCVVVVQSDLRGMVGRMFD